MAMELLVSALIILSASWLFVNIEKETNKVWLIILNSVALFVVFVVILQGGVYIYITRGLPLIG